MLSYDSAPVTVLYYSIVLKRDLNVCRRNRKTTKLQVTVLSQNFPEAAEYFFEPSQNIPDSAMYECTYRRIRDRSYKNKLFQTEGENRYCLNAHYRKYQ